MPARRQLEHRHVPRCANTRGPSRTDWCGFPAPIAECWMMSYPKRAAREETSRDPVLGESVDLGDRQTANGTDRLERLRRPGKRILVLAVRVGDVRSRTRLVTPRHWGAITVSACASD